MPKLLTNDQEYSRRTLDHESTQTALRSLCPGDNEVLTTLTSFVGPWRENKTACPRFSPHLPLESQFLSGLVLTSAKS